MSAFPVLAADAAPRETLSPLALSCLTCHPRGLAQDDPPDLARMSPAAIETALRAARQSHDANAVMPRFAAGLDDADIQQLARQLGQTPAP